MNRRGKFHAEEDVQMLGSTQLLVASVLVSTVLALVWLQAPLIPAAIGAVGGGVVLYVRQRRTVRAPATH